MKLKKMFDWDVHKVLMMDDDEARAKKIDRLMDFYRRRYDEEISDLKTEKKAVLFELECYRP
jgi:hypothetical protein